MLPMSDFIQQSVLPILNEVVDPLTNKSLLVLDAVSEIKYIDKTLSLLVTLGYPSGDQNVSTSDSNSADKKDASIQQTLSQTLWSKLGELDNVDAVNIDFTWRSPVNVSIPDQPLLKGVSNIVAVASGKGGVGKSTTTVNLALALAKLGAKVGILDADVYGPSQPTMLGLGVKRPEVHDQKVMMPNESHGIKSMSMGYLVTEDTPMVWRGPMATGALQQLIFQTDWQELDYLFVDMPPGTGDIQLTLSQRVPVSGAVIVTTPQDIALLDAKKAVEMFAKVSIPVLGVVENMAVHKCSHCGHEEHIFGEGGGERIAGDYGTELLGALPLALSIRESADSGKPSVVAEPDSDITQHYVDIAQKMAAALWLQKQQAGDDIELIVSDD